jgi:hypothetical protein
VFWSRSCSSSKESLGEFGPGVFILGDFRQERLYEDRDSEAWNSRQSILPPEATALIFMHRMRLGLHS